MTEQQFLRRWYTSLTAGVAVVVAVAGLLLAIIGTARSILGHAGRAIGIADQIVTNTRPIWDLDTTNAVAAQLLDGAKAIETHATEVADALDPGPAAGHIGAT
ncbi:MAG: hypothetical protein H0U40_07125 [Chloroflexia bacterium]|nr:hypothetical protein [Chloroflexia bacterium]